MVYQSEILWITRKSLKLVCFFNFYFSVKSLKIVGKIFYDSQIFHTQRTFRQLLDFFIKKRHEIDRNFNEKF